MSVFISVYIMTVSMR